MIVGCYTSHLYCDYPEEGFAHRGSGEWPGPGFASFTGRTFAETKRKARANGWRFSADGERCLCPSCIKAGRKLPRKGTTP